MPVACLTKQLRVGSRLILHPESPSGLPRFEDRNTFPVSDSANSNFVPGIDKQTEVEEPSEDGVLEDLQQPFREALYISIPFRMPNREPFASRQELRFRGYEAG